MRAGLLSLLLLLALTGTARADYLNPVLPGNYPDPTVVQVGEDFYASTTSDRWAPGLPILRSRDLVSWEQIGSAFDVAPRWATGRRFWAPSLSFTNGRFVLLFSGLKTPGKFCIGAATAADPAGPWTEDGPIFCPPGGAIDPNLVTREDGTSWLVYKNQGLGGGLSARPIDANTFDLLGPPTLLIGPDRLFEAGVTEGASLFQENGTWHLVYSGGGCCRPPCNYVAAVARAPDLLGPWEKRETPVLVGGPEWRCPGHGDVLRLTDGSLQYLHHAYDVEDLTNRQRQGVLSPVRIDAEGWPAIGAPTDSPFAAGTPLISQSSPLSPSAPVANTSFRDRFTTPALLPGWQWQIRRALPEVETGDRRLRLRCGEVSGLVTRQVGAERFSLAVTVQPTRGKTLPALVVRDNGGTLRGVELTPRGVRSIRRRGGEIRLGRNIAVPRKRSVRLRVTVAPGGNIATYVSTRGGTRRVPEGEAAYGGGPTRIGLTCRGGGTGVFSDLRLAGDGTTPVAVPAVAPLEPLPEDLLPPPPGR
ncbi:MAG: family 43 glycosylhydrolase [Solirubrobacterales bacterium]|nr:family 43 glycosylhydrolase [Solirubrobacterales bacterium]